MVSVTYNPEEARRKGVKPLMGWYWSPHFHVLSVSFVVVMVGVGVVVKLAIATVNGS